MKRRIVTLSIVLTISMLLMTLLAVSGCGGKKGKEGDVMRMLPENSMAVIIVNVQELTKLPIFDKMIKESEEKKVEKPDELFKNYRDFVTKTGIDPKKDIFTVGVAVMGKIGEKEPDAVAVLNLNYNKDKILGLIKEKGGKITEEAYKGIPGFKFQENGKNRMFSFVSSSIIAVGVPDGVKKVIDISKGGKSVLDNKNMKPFLGKMKSDAIVSFLVEIPGTARKVHDVGMFKADLRKAEAVLGFMDYDSKNWNGEIEMISKNEEGNQQLVTALNSVKMIGGAAGPEFAELVNNINITGSAESIKVKIAISEALFEKLQEKVKKQQEAMTPPPPAAEEQPKEEPKTGEK